MFLTPSRCPPVTKSSRIEATIHFRFIEGKKHWYRAILKLLDFLSMNAICVAKINIINRLYLNCYAFASKKALKLGKKRSMEMSSFIQFSGFVSASVVHLNCGNWINTGRYWQFYEVTCGKRWRVLSSSHTNQINLMEKLAVRFNEINLNLISLIENTKNRIRNVLDELYKKIFNWSSFEMADIPLKQNNYRALGRINLTLMGNSHLVIWLKTLY